MNPLPDVPSVGLQGKRRADLRSMALITCKDCGGNVSTNALACPACGRPSEQSADICEHLRTHRDTGLTGRDLFAFLALLAVGTIFFGGLLGVVPGFAIGFTCGLLLLLLQPKPVVCDSCGRKRRGKPSKE